MIRDALGDRMKHNYEEVTKTRLTRRMPVIIRLDGCHFHTVTKGFKKPFDDVMIKTMQDTMKYLCENIQGCVLGYTQSDEITLVLQDFKELTTDAWFDYEVQKMCSVSAAMATFAFNKFFAQNVKDWGDKPAEVTAEGIEEDLNLFNAYEKVIKNGAYFDSRVFNVPKEEVANCLIWRQKDAERNSINSLAQSLFSHKSLQGLKLKDTLTKIEQEAGVVWGELPTTYKRGSCCVKVYDRIIGGVMNSAGYTDLTMPETTSDPIKGTWTIDNNIPQFTDDRYYIEKLIYFYEKPL